MDIYLHNITCDNTVLDKTAYLNATPLKVTAYFKGVPQDELYPVLIFKKLANKYNYVYIQELNSYYFITRTIILNDSQIELRLEKDVLFSNLTKIKNSSAILKRSYTHGLNTLRDETDAFDETVSISYTSLTSYAVSEFNINDQDTFLLVYYDDMGGGAGTGISDLYTQFSNSYDDGIKPLITNCAIDLGYQQTGTNYRILNYTQVFMLSRAILSDENLLSSVKGLYKIPMQTSETNELKFRVVNTNTTKIRLGSSTIDLKLNAQDTSTLYAPYSFRSRWVYENFTLYTNDVYKNYYFSNPYSRYEIWCPFVGWVEIPAANLINKNLKIYYTLNLENGESTCNIYDAASETIIVSKNANFMLQIPLSTLNMRDMQDRKTSLTLNTLIGAISSIVAIAGGAVSGNAVAVAGGVISAGKVASSAITGFTQLHPSANVALQNSNSSWQSRIDFVLKRTYKNIHRIIDTKLGRPCNTTVYPISSETGYFEGVNLILSDNSDLSKDEIEKIKVLIEKGVYAS